MILIVIYQVIGNSHFVEFVDPQIKFSGDLCFVPKKIEINIYSCKKQTSLRFNYQIEKV